jgi:DNA polymerase zeta
MVDSSGPLGAPPFQLRIVQIDYYMAGPIPGLDVCFSPFESDAVQLVPVVRIFGATPAGQMACLHLHRVSQPLHLATGSAEAKRCTWEESSHTMMPSAPQAFPYFYVPYDDSLPTQVQEGTIWTSASSEACSLSS